MGLRATSSLLLADSSDLLSAKGAEAAEGAEKGRCSSRMMVTNPLKLPLPGTYLERQLGPVEANVKL